MNQAFDIHLLKNAVYESASTIKDLREGVKVFSKKHEVDLVTEADLRSEEILVNAIKKEFPNDGIISEESETVNPKADRFWVIDPLDGTVNYANDIPQVAITLMLIEDSSPTQAYVYDIYNEILYEGYKGNGAFKNSEKLEVSKSTSMQKAIVATGFPYDRVHHSDQYIPTFEAVLKSCGGIRRFGSAALDVCWIADNKFDAYFEFFMKPWDTLGASLILEEAGGKVVDETDNFPSTESNLLVASNSEIHHDFKNIVFSNIHDELKGRFSFSRDIISRRVIVKDPRNYF